MFVCCRINNNIKENSNSVGRFATAVATFLLHYVRETHCYGLIFDPDTFFKSLQCEKLHLKFSKWVLGVHKKKLIYCGRKLIDNQSLESVGLKAGATVFALKKHFTEKEEAIDTDSDVDVRQLVQVVKSALLTQDYGAIVEKMVNNPENLDNIIATSPGLEKDPVAIAMLQDRALLAILAHPGNVRQVLEKHPSFGPAAMMVAAAVCEEGSKMEAGMERLAPGAYSLDQMSDDEDMEPQNRQGTSAGTPRSAITPAQLAAALAAAGGSPQAGTSSQSQGANNFPEGPPIITSDFFSQAMNQAQSQTAPSDDQIQQLRDMGITDEALARRALQATGGDLQAALDLIFGDGHF